MKDILKDKLFYNGQWKQAGGSDYLEVVNPADKKVFDRVPVATEEEIEFAIQGAKKALNPWRMMDKNERIDIVEKMAKYLEDWADQIAPVLSRELGVPLAHAGARQIDGYFRDIAKYIESARAMEMIEVEEGFEVHKEPVGVVACLTPWNFPFGQIVRKVFPALIMGNTVVLKPSQHTPLTARFFGQAAEKAELPEGAFQLLFGRGAELGNILASHPDIDMVSFTGSSTGGREVGKLAIDDVKRLALELGGKSAAIILEGISSEDLEDGLTAVLNTVYSNAGQSCSAKTRLLVPRSMKEEVEALLIRLSEGYIFGDPSDKKSFAGPLQSQKQLDKVRRYLEIGKEEAELLYEGPVHASGGYYQGPVIFTEVNPDAKIAQEEIFGPVLAVLFYENEEEAIEIANNSVYGLSSAIYGDQRRARELAKYIFAGEVFIGTDGDSTLAPFGGYKHSGIGRECGPYVLDEFIELKALII